MFQFTGFARPQANWYRLPNTWFDLWRELRQQTQRTRIQSVLKVTEYVIKHTWGRQNFDTPIRIAWNDFLYGLQRGGHNLDRGTGLSRRALQRALENAQAFGLLEQPTDEAGNATFTYLPKMLPEAQDAPGFLEDGITAWQGFTPPTSNYFKVPAIWTDMTAQLSSEAALLAVEYLFRHTWGWESWDGRACWLTEDDVARGRQYRSRERNAERYDAGIGYSQRAVRDGLREAVTQGLLVWREQDSARHPSTRQYALYLQGMRVSEEGEFLGWEDPAKCALPENTSRSQAPQPTIPEPSHTDLQVKFTQLTQLIKSLLSVLQQAGIPLENLMTDEMNTEASRLFQEESRPALEASRPSKEESKPPYIKTLPNNQETLSSNTRAASKIRGNDDGSILADLIPALDRIGYHRTTEGMREFLNVYLEAPAYIRTALQHLAQTRADDPQAAGFFRQMILRERIPFPPSDPYPTQPSCPNCQGSGYVLEGDHALRCPICHSAPMSANTNHQTTLEHLDL